MALTHRRFLYIIFFIVFFTLAPIIILYASGYRYNFKKNTWQKTGLIFLETQPKNVDIVLNGQVIDQNSPVHIKDLLPNQYTLEITKDNYTTWQKKIDVFEGQSTSLQYIRLFIQNPIPKILAEGQFMSASISPDRDKIVLIKKDGLNNQVIVVNTDNIRPNDVYSTRSQIEKIEFSSGQEKLIIYFKNNVVLVDIHNPGNTLDFVKESQVYTATNLKVNPANPNFVYYLLSDKLYGFDLISKGRQELNLSPTSLIDYYVKDGRIYYLANESLNKTLLKKVNLAENDSKETLATLDSSKNLELLEITHNFVVISNKLKKEIILISLSDGSQEVIKNVDYSFWSSNNKELLFGNSLELWTYNGETQEYTLFTRTGQEISQSQWYSVDTHLFYILDNQTLKITENLVSNRQVTDILTLDHIQDVLVNKKGDKIYFIATIGNQQGLYELEIQ